MGNCLFLHARGWGIDRQMRTKLQIPGGMPGGDMVTGRIEPCIMHQSIPAAPIPPRATAGHLRTPSVPGVGHWIDRRGLDKLVEVFSILCISSLLIKAQLELSLYIARLETINVNRRTHASLIKDLNKI